MDAFRKRIHRVVHDDAHGSSFLLNELLETFHIYQPGHEELRWAFQQLHKIDPAMVIIYHFIRSLQDKIGTDFQKSLRNYIDRWKNVEASVANELMELLSGIDLNLLTHSHSGMIIKVVETLAQKGYSLKIWQTESLPGGEGSLQAQAFQDLGLKVWLIPDEEVAAITDQINACLLGVDHFDQRA